MVADYDSTTAELGLRDVKLGKPSTVKWTKFDSQSCRIFDAVCFRVTASQSSHSVCLRHKLYGENKKHTETLTPPLQSTNPENENDLFPRASRDNGIIIP
ncbi:hypothetical protein JOB18_047278 [Solea senegalensis]|uniref:Uncharacterized protein n=1 Tax=Solea senegalensis TaxID=28829 RepID=A0AAV6RGJ0_SOLSE|nr:hypothetical protein JOB18_047278 [Solea senegalensis]